MKDEHFAVNRRNWNERAAIHARSAVYDLAAYRTDLDRLPVEQRAMVPMMYTLVAERPA